MLELYGSPRKLVIECILLRNEVCSYVRLNFCFYCSNNSQLGLQQGPYFNLFLVDIRKNLQLNWLYQKEMLDSYHEAPLDIHNFCMQLYICACKLKKAFRSTKLIQIMSNNTFYYLNFKNSLIINTIIGESCQP